MKKAYFVVLKEYTPLRCNFYGFFWDFRDFTVCNVHTRRKIKICKVEKLLSGRIETNSRNLSSNQTFRKLFGTFGRKFFKAFGWNWSPKIHLQFTISFLSIEMHVTLIFYYFYCAADESSITSFKTSKHRTAPNSAKTEWNNQWNNPKPALIFCTTLPQDTKNSR